MAYMGYGIYEDFMKVRHEGYRGQIFLTSLLLFKGVSNLELAEPCLINFL